VIINTRKLSNLNIRSNLNVNLLSKLLLLIIIGVLFAVSMNVVFAATVVYDEFNDGESEVTLLFEEVGVEQNFFIRLPKNETITSGSMIISGANLQGSQTSPADIVLVTDTSGSMGWCFDGNRNTYYCNPSNPIRIDTAKSALNEFIDTVDVRGIHVGLAEYASEGDLNLHLTDDKSAMYNVVGGYSPYGGTNIGGGLKIAVRELLNPSYAQDTEDKYILLMSDGQVTAHDSTDCSPCCAFTNDADYALCFAEQAALNGITIFSVAFSTGASANFMNELATITGGQGFEVLSPTALSDIYTAIAEFIQVEDFPTPEIDTPNILDAWSYNSTYSGNNTWIDNDCGPAANCQNLRTILQQELELCVPDLEGMCNIDFSITTDTIGQLTFSELFITTNGPPESNFPPLGVCYTLPFVCGPGVYDVLIDAPINGSYFVEDPNDPISSLSWVFKESTPNPNFFSINSDYNETRTITFTVDPAHLYEFFNAEYIFDVTDPWGAATQACLQAQYDGCSDFVVQDMTVIFDSDNSSTIIDLYSMITSHTGVVGNLSYDLPSVGSETTYFLISGDIVNGENESSMITVVPKTITSSSNETINVRIIDNVAGERTAVLRIEYYYIEPPDPPLNPQNYNCTSPVCISCFGNPSTLHSCLASNNCFSTSNILPVWDPSVAFKINNIIGSTIPVDFFTMIASSPSFSASIISNNRFLVSSPAVLGTSGAIVIDVLFVGYSNPVKMCFELEKVEYDIGIVPEDQDTRLLVTGSRSITGYYEHEGVVHATDPYIYTAKVWLKR